MDISLVIYQYSCHVDVMICNKLSVKYNQTSLEWTWGKKQMSAYKGCPVIGGQSSTFSACKRLGHWRSLSRGFLLWEISEMCVYCLLSTVVLVRVSYWAGLWFWQSGGYNPELTQILHVVPWVMFFTNLWTGLLAVELM